MFILTREETLGNSKPDTPNNNIQLVINDITNVMANIASTQAKKGDIDPKDKESKKANKKERKESP